MSGVGHEECSAAAAASRSQAKLAELHDGLCSCAAARLPGRACHLPPRCRLPPNHLCALQPSPASSRPGLRGARVGVVSLPRQRLSTHLARAPAHGCRGGCPARRGRRERRQRRRGRRRRQRQRRLGAGRPLAGRLPAAAVQVGAWFDGAWRRWVGAALLGACWALPVVARCSGRRSAVLQPLLASLCPRQPPSRCLPRAWSVPQGVPRPQAGRAGPVLVQDPGAPSP